jgi:hypothetical protein
MSVKIFQNVHKIYRNIFQSRALQHVGTQIGIFGLKRNHLATLLLNPNANNVGRQQQQKMEKGTTTAPPPKKV